MSLKGKVKTTDDPKGFRLATPTAKPSLFTDPQRKLMIDLVKHLDPDSGEDKRALQKAPAQSLETTPSATHNVEPNIFAQPWVTYTPAPETKTPHSIVHSPTVQAHLDKLQQLINQIQKQIDSYDGFLGILAICKLGAPFYVHSIDFQKTILIHFKQGESLGSLQAAEPYAQTSAYLFVEVYHDRLVCVNEGQADHIIKL